MPANVWTGTNGAPVSTFHVDSDRRDLYCSPIIKYLVPEATPFLHILNEIGVESVDSMEFYCYDSEPGARWTKINNAAGYDAAATTLVVDDATIFKPFDTIKVPRTGEVMLVKTVPDATTITVDRAIGREVIGGSVIGGTAAAPLNDDDNLLRMGSALAEGADPADPRARQPIKIYNYIQDFSDTISGTMTNENEAKKTNQSERQRLRRDMFFKHRLDIATSILLNERNEIISDKRRLTGGLLYFIPNTYDVATENSGYLTWGKFIEFCEMLFTYGSKNKILITSPKIIGIINSFAEAKIVTEVASDTYGLELQKIITPFGRLKLAYSQAFEKDYASMGIGVDLENVRLKVFGGNWLKLRQNIQEKRSHGWEDELYTQCGLEVRLHKSHAILTGVAA